MVDGDTLVNAAIGGAVALVTSFLLGPASPVAGGAVAGYLQRGDTRDGAVVGAITGLIALVPFLLFVGLFAVVGFAPVLGVFGTVPIETMTGPPGGFPAFGGGLFPRFVARVRRRSTGDRRVRRARGRRRRLRRRRDQLRELIWSVGPVCRGDHAVAQSIRT